MDFELSKLKQTVRRLDPQPVEVKNKFAVLIPFLMVEDEVHILYEKRASTLRSQPNEVSFPGGRIEPGETARKAACRETCEELCLPPDKIEIYAQGDYLVNPYRAMIYTFIGEIKEQFHNIEPSPAEVDRCFTVPLRYFMEVEPEEYDMNIQVEQEPGFPFELIPHGRDYNFKRGKEVVQFYEYDDEIIWGFTAKMTYNLIRKLRIFYK